MTVRLHRRVLARCRPIGSFPELIVSMAFVAAVLFAPAILTSDLYTTRDRVLLIAVGVASGVVRAAIATEWAQADIDGVTWRVWFVRRHYSWDEIQNIGFGDTPVFLGRCSSAVYVDCTYSPTGARPQELPPDRWTVTPSLFAGRKASEDFVLAAQAMRPESKT